MIEDAVKIDFTDEELFTLGLFAYQKSFNRRNKTVFNSRNTIAKDQLTGVIGECAMYKYVLGAYGFDNYVRVRKDRNRPNNLYTGDGGIDIVAYGRNIDVKCSHWHNDYRELSTYPLFVRPWQMHEGTTYVMALSKQFGKAEQLTWSCYLVGWANWDECKDALDEYGKQRFIVQSDRLYPMSTLKELEMA